MTSTKGISQIDYEIVFQQIVKDPRYQANLDWGKPRAGHPEGTVRAHIVELEQNLELLKSRLNETEYWKLKILIHVHDTFKAAARESAAILDADSHASLARSFLAEYCADPDLLAMVQFHDESYALYRQVRHKARYNIVHKARYNIVHKARYNIVRWQTLLERIHDWNLFAAFHIIDGCTAGKDREPLQWLFEQLKGQVALNFTTAEIID